MRPTGCAVRAANAYRSLPVGRMVARVVGGQQTGLRSAINSRQHLLGVPCFLMMIMLPM